MRYSFDIEVGAQRLTILAHGEREIIAAAGTRASMITFLDRRGDVYPNKMDYDVCLPEESDIFIKTLKRSK